jgi:hypothetical protein
MRFAYSALSIAIVSILNTSVYAEQNSQDDVVNLSAIVLQAQDDAPKNTLGKTVYSKADLEKIPNSSKNITDFLKVNPNVQFNRDARSASQQGELSPQDISINGGLAYDNKFVINGVGFNNNINPATDAGSNSNSDLMGSSQAVAINTDLLCELTVLDSNVSAEYGEFIGGVVQAKTCAPKTAVGKLHGQINYDYTSDDWSRINFTSQAEEISFEQSTDEGTQPEFVKQGLSANLYGNLTDRFGFSLAGTKRWSKIPLNTKLDDPKRITQTRDANNLALELFYQLNDKNKLKFGAQAFENQGDYSQSNVKDSESTHLSDSQSVYLNLETELDGVKLEQQLNYQTQAAERDGAPHVYTWRRSETKNWASTATVNEGSFGQMQQEEEKLEYSLKASFDPIQQGDLTHRIKAGTGYGHYEAFWERPKTSYWYTTTANLKGAPCLDTLCDSATTANGFNGQYFSGRTVYGAGEINVQQDRWHAYVEDAMQWNDTWFATLGLRSDYDSLTKETNLAPRSSFGYQPFNSPVLRISTGWNRYYGLNAFANEVQAQKRLLQYSETDPNHSGTWKKTLGSDFANMLENSQLETPYSDEISLGLSGEVKNWAWALKWVNRDNQKLLRQSEWETLPKPEGSGTYTTYTYDNSGVSESDIYTLSLENQRPIQWANMAHRFSLAADYTDTIRNFNDYNARSSDPSEIIYYDGKLIANGDRPADNFNTPWTVRMGWDMQFDHLPLKLNHFLSYRSSSDKMKSNTAGYTDEQGNVYTSWTPTKSKSSFSWDVRGQYQLFKTTNYASTLGLTINNLTNKHNTYISDDGSTKSEIGRQFIADITFKF